VGQDSSAWGIYFTTFVFPEFKGHVFRTAVDYKILGLIKCGTMMILKKAYVNNGN